MKIISDIFVISFFVLFYLESQAIVINNYISFGQHGDSHTKEGCSFFVVGYG